MNICIVLMSHKCLYRVGPGGTQGAHQARGARMGPREGGGVVAGQGRRLRSDQTHPKRAAMSGGSCQRKSGLRGAGRIERCEREGRTYGERRRARAERSARGAAAASRRGARGRAGGRSSRRNRSRGPTQRRHRSSEWRPGGHT